MLIHQCFWMLLNPWFQKSSLRCHQWRFGWVCHFWSRCRVADGWLLLVCGCVTAYWKGLRWSVRIHGWGKSLPEEGTARAVIQRIYTDDHVTFLCAKDLLRSLSNLQMVFYPFGVPNPKIYYTSFMSSVWAIQLLFQLPQMLSFSSTPAGAIISVEHLFSKV